MPWIDQRGDTCFVSKDIANAIERNNKKPWESTESDTFCLTCSEGSVTVDFSQPFSWRDIFSLIPLEHNFKFACFSDAVFLGFPNLSFIVIDNHIYCRRIGVKEEEATEVWLAFLKFSSAFKALDTVLLSEKVPAETIVENVLLFVQDFLCFLWDNWKSVDYSAPSKKDLRSGHWRELAENWIDSFRELHLELKLFASMISTMSFHDQTLTYILPSPAVFLERLSEVLNEMDEWRTTVERVENSIPLYFQQQETFLLKLDLPIVVGAALIGFALLVMGFTCMNITIPPYNSPDIIKIWAVFVSILAVFLLVSFSFVFHWLRKNAPLTDLFQ